MPTLAPLDWIILGIYPAVVLTLGLRAASRRKSGSEDYILAGRGLSLPAFVATLVTSFYGGVLGVGEYTYRFGISNWLIQGFPYYVFAGLYAWFLAGRVRGTAGLTIPDHVERVYGKSTAALAALLVFVLASPADDLLMLGTLFSWITGLKLALSVLACTLLASSYLFLGGMRSEVSTGKFELICMFVGFSLVLPFGFRAVGGWSALKTALPPLHTSWTGGNSTLYILTWFFIALWTFVDPSFHQRVCAAKDVATARWGIVASVMFWAVFDFMTTSAGLYARVLLPYLQDPLYAFPSLAQKLLPAGVLGLFLAGMSSSILAALSAKSFISAISLGKDGLGRISPARSAGAEERRIRWALGACCLLAVCLALALPSVVSLWYVIGSTTIPPLLVILISAYFTSLRVPPQAAFAAGAAGWICALVAWRLGHPVPFYPGLGAALGVWGFARMSS